MRTKEIQFDGKTYICRIVDSIDGEELLIGSTELLDALQELIEVLKESNPDWFE